MNESEESTLPLVSVVIPTYNRAHVVCDAIDSVLTQTYRNFEIIVVDDASTDGTEAVLARYGDRIRLIRRAANGGVSAARNDGIRAARGELVSFLDSDDIYLPNRLEVAVRFLTSHPECGAVYTIVLAELWPGGPRTACTLGPRPLPTGRIFDKMLQNNVYALGFTPGHTIRRQVLEAVGGFDESLSFWEDIELWWRVSRVTMYGCVDEPTCVARPRPRVPPAGSLASAGWVAATQRVVTGYRGLTCRERRLALVLHCSNLRRHGIRLAAEGRWLDASRVWLAAIGQALNGGLLVSAGKTMAAPLWAVVLGQRCEATTARMEKLIGSLKSRATHLLRPSERGA